MIYLPSDTSEAIYAEATNPDGSTKWWIAAYAEDAQITFTCWGNHQSCPDVTIQGKTIARGAMAFSQYRNKIEEKRGKEYQILAKFDGSQWIGSVPSSCPIPTQSTTPGTQIGHFTMATISGQTSEKRLNLILYQTPNGYRLDHREWQGQSFTIPTFPDWQTLYPDIQSAFTAITAVRDGRLARGLKVATDSIPWELAVNMASLSQQDWVINGESLNWDF